MQDLKEMILLLEQNNLPPLRHQKNGADAQMEALYTGIQSGKVHTDEEAMHFVYGPAASGASYQKLKSDLRDRLLEGILQIKCNPGEASDYQQAHYECYREWAAVRFLTGRNANTAALSVATRLFAKVKKFRFTFLCIDIAAYLRAQYSLREINRRKYKEACAAYEYYRNLFEAEAKAEERYTTLMSRYVDNRAAFLNDHKLAIAYAEELQPYMQSYQGYRLQLYGYLVGLIRHTAANDYQQAAAVCKEAIHYFKSLPFDARVPLQIFYHQQLICHIQLRQAQEGEATARHCQQYLKTGTFNWFKFRETYLYLLLHTRQYGKAAQILAATRQQEQFEHLPEPTREVWAIYELYIYLLHAMGHIGSSGPQKTKPAPLIPEIPSTPNDKTGQGAAMLIIKTIIQLQEKRYPELVDQTEALEQYCHRHLRSKNTRRSYYFIKMLLQIPPSGFDPAGVAGKVKPLQKQLNAAPQFVADQTLELEIIPFDHLWSLVLEILDKNKGKVS